MKNYRAAVSFAGQVSMAAGEVREIPEDLAAPLVRCGYLKEADQEGEKPSASPSKPVRKTCGEPP